MEKNCTLPDPIKMKTMSGEGIVLVAETAKSYKKYFVNQYEEIDCGEEPDIFRWKIITLPVNRDGIQFNTVHELFEYLTSEGQSYIPI